jgi:ABC-type polysaccharide/polyol phosphate export permease
MTTANTVMDRTVSDNTADLGALSPRVGLLGGLRQTFSLSWRTPVQIKHNPAELIDFSIQPVMFLLLFTYVFGSAIGGSPHTYLMFALPGIIVQNSLFTTLNTATGLSTDLEKGFFDRLRSLPIARFAPLSGRILTDIAKQAWAVIMLLAIGYILGFRVGTGPLGVLAAFGLVLISTLAVSWALVLVAMLAANPVSLISDAMRGLTVSGPAARPAVESLLYAAAFTIVFAPLAVRAFKRRV